MTQIRENIRYVFISVEKHDNTRADSTMIKKKISKNFQKLREY